MGRALKLKIDFVALAKKFAGQWVALDPKDYRVIAAASTATEAMIRAADSGEDDPVVFKVIADYAAIAPCLVRF